VTSAEANALRLVSGTSTAIDGYIGIGNSSSIYFPANGGTIGKSQYDAVGIAAHEISEVMGRVSLDDTTLSTSRMLIHRLIFSGTQQPTCVISRQLPAISRQQMA
jgi:hypothetical protein